MNRTKSRVTTTLLERRTRALQRWLPAAVRGDHHGVHQARVATRRLREAVPVLTTGVKGSKTTRARRNIRRLTRALGTVRELDVTMQILDELARRPEIPRNALEDVRAHVLAERDGRRKVMLHRLEDVDSEKLTRRLRAVAATLAECESNPWRETLGTRLVKRAKRFSEAVQEAGHIYAPDRLHEVRIAAKKLRYALELADEAGVAAAHARVSTLKRAQDALGRLHDLQVLQRHVAHVQSAPPTGRGGGDALAAIGRALEAECRHLHGKYLASSGALLEVAEACQTVIVPRLARVPQLRPRRVPLKMSMSLRRSRPKTAARRA